MASKIIKKYRSKEEMAELIRLYEASGKSIRQWSLESDILLSTISGWLRRHENKSVDKEIIFVNLIPKDPFLGEEVSNNLFRRPRDSA